METSKKETKPLIYVASPYTQGDPALNVKCQIDLFRELIGDNLVTPFIPLLSHYIQIIYPLDYETWLQYDFEMISKCDGIFRINAELPNVDYYQHESSGADREIAYAKELNIPVFYSKGELYNHFLVI
jgi:hypothetical protein